MKKNLALMALTGILTLASCAQNSAPTNQAVGGTPGEAICASDACYITIGTNIPSATVVVKDSSGKAVYSGKAGKAVVKALGKYTVVANAVAGYKTPASQTVTINDHHKTENVHVEYHKAATTGMIKITSPKEDQVVKPGALKVTFEAKDVKNLKCDLDGKVFPISGNTCTVQIPDKAGNFHINITGVGTKDGKNVKAEVHVNVKKAAKANVKPGFNHEQQIVETVKTDYDKPAFEKGAWRLLPHQKNDKAIPEVAYVRGKVWVDAVDKAAKPDRVQIWVADTANAPATDYLYDGAPKYKAFEFNTAEYNGKQGQVQYLVSRTSVQGGKDTTTSFPFIVDNAAPQAPDVEIATAGGKEDRYIRELRNIRDFNWAKGAVENRISNTDLVDLAGKMPSGLDRITYYYIPADKNPGVPTWKQGDRIAKIKKAATKTLAVEAGGNGNRYAAQYDSVAEKDAEGQTYYIYAIATDQLGNESDSTTFEKISFDNHAPKVKASIRDVSPLPFASCDANQYISDYFSFSNTKSEDKGVGFAALNRREGGNNVVSLNNISVPLGGFLNKKKLVHTIRPLHRWNIYDSNLVGDGRTQLDARVSDLLGNTVDEKMGNFLIDNTDPAVEFKAPAVGANLTAGQAYSVNTNVTENGSGLDNSRTYLLWNDYIHDVPAGNTKRTRKNGFVGAPVSFANGTAASWTALAAASDYKGVDLMNLAVDCAGNAAIGRRTVNVSGDVDVEAKNLPVLGKWDVYRYNKAPKYTLPKQGKLHAFDGDDNFRDLKGDKDGLFMADMVVAGTNSRTNGKINTVSFHRELLWTSWDAIVVYMTGKKPNGKPVRWIEPKRPVITTARAGRNKETPGSNAGDIKPRHYFYNIDPTIWRQGKALAQERALNWVNVTDTSSKRRRQVEYATPMLNDWNTETSANYYRIKGQFKHQEHGVQGVTAMVTDTKGMYSYTRDEEGSYSVRNMTSETTLNATHTEGDEVALDFSVALPYLTPELLSSSFQVSEDGVNFKDIPVGIQFSGGAGSFAGATFALRTIYKADPEHKWLRVRVAGGKEKYFSQAFKLNVVADKE